MSPALMETGRQEAVVRFGQEPWAPAAPPQEAFQEARLGTQEPDIRGGLHPALATQDHWPPPLTQLWGLMEHRKSDLVPAAILPRPAPAGSWDPAASSNTKGIGHLCRASGQTHRAHSGPENGLPLILPPDRPTFWPEEGEPAGLCF